MQEQEMNTFFCCDSCNQKIDKKYRHQSGWCLACYAAKERGQMLVCKSCRKIVGGTYNGLCYNCESKEGAKQKMELPSIFKQPGRTLKLEINNPDTVFIGKAVEDALLFLKDNLDKYNRIEFPLNGYYFVVAKLKHE